MGREHLTQYTYPDVQRFRVMDTYSFGNTEEVQLEQFLYWHDVPDLQYRITVEHLETVARRLLHLARLAAATNEPLHDWEGGGLRKPVELSAIDDVRVKQYLLWFDSSPGKLRTEHLKAVVAQMRYLEVKVARAVKV